MTSFTLFVREMGSCCRRWWRSCLSLTAPTERRPRDDRETNNHELPLTCLRNLRYAAVALFILLGVGNAWGQAATTYTFTSTAWGTTQSAWTSDKAGTQTGDARGIAIQAAASGAGAHTAPISNITKVAINCSKSSKGVGSISVKVGNTKVISRSSFNTTDTQYESSDLNNLTGSVSFTVTCTTSTIYVKSITITTTSGSTYTITYDCDGADSGCPSTASGQTALPNPLPASPIKAGYEFNGWYTNSTKTTAAVAGASLSDDVTLYAKWVSCHETTTVFYPDQGSKPSVGSYNYTGVHNPGNNTNINSASTNSLTGQTFTSCNGTQISFSHSSGSSYNTIWYASSTYDIRLYQNNPVTFTAPTGYIVKSVSKTVGATTTSLTSNNSTSSYSYTKSGNGGEAVKYFTVTIEATCTQLASINGSVSWTNGTQATLSWDDVDHVSARAVTVHDNTSNSDVDAENIGTPSDQGTTYQCVVSNLTAGHEYDFNIALTAASGYCDKSQEITATAPLITASGTIDGLNYAEGSGPSTAKSFTVSGVGLTGDITVTAPTNFEVSKSSGSGYGSSVSFSPTSGTLASSTVYVRLAAGKSVDTYNGNITISGGGAANNTSVTVQGVVSPACHDPNITSQPASSTTYNLNATATELSVTATKGDEGDPDLTYQWYSNTADSKTTPAPTLIGGATSSSYTPPTNATGTKYYFCEVSSGICSTTSDIAAVTVNTPTLTVSETARAFGERAINGSYTMTFTVSGTNLAKDAGISLAISGTNAGLFSIDKSSLSATANAVAGTTITVTYSPNAVGSHSATITISSTGAANQTVALSGSVSNYTLTWDFTTGGSSCETAGTHYTADGSVTHGAALTYPSDMSMSKNGYTFTGWDSDASTMPGNNLTITAQWEAKQYTVTLDNKGATTSGSTSVTATFGQAIPTIIPPTKTGYRFDGYWTAASGGTKYINADGTSAHTYDKWSSDPATHKLHAHWVAQLTFSVNGEVDDDLTRDDNTAMPTSATVPTACGDCWAFMGWSTNSSESSAPAYAGGDTHEFGSPTTLYAVFGKAEYKMIRSTSELVANDYYVVASSTEWALSNADHSYYTSSSYSHTDAASTDISSISKYNASGYYIYNPPASIIWKFSGTKDAGQLQNVATPAKYVNLTATNLLATAQDLKFSVSADGESWIIQYSTTNFLHGYTDTHGNGFETLSSSSWEDDDYSAFLYHQMSAEYATVPSCETYDIVWKVNGTPLVSGSQTEETNACAGIEELPTDPDDDELDCATKFMGWSESTLIGTGKSAPADLFTDVADAPAIDADKTFHAVFASVDTDSETPADITTTFTSISWGDENSLWTSDKTATNNDDSRGIQVNKNESGAGAHTITSYNKVTSVVITYGSASSASGSIAVSVGGTAMTLSEGSISGGQTDQKLTYTPTTPATDLTGAVSFVATVTNKSIYVKSIKINYAAFGYKDYMTSCCDELVTLTTNSPANGTITFAPAGPIATCEANQNVTMTITPSPGYKLSAWSVATGDGKVAAANTTPAVVTGEDNSDEQEITLTFSQHTTGNYDVSATFEQMHDEYFDYMHDNAKVGGNRTGAYYAPSRDSKTAASGEDCKTNHYKFKGWVVQEEINDDGTLKSGYTLITAGSSMTASNKIYYAVWAEEE